MSSNSILIEGKEYISSDRAAKLVGYTKDYVGQLARAGKIQSKRIGRSWYIAEESINKHKLTVHYVLTKPKKSHVKSSHNDVITNRNIDISSKHEFLQKVKEPVLHGKITDTQINVSAFEKEEADLFPRLRDKKHDALLHSDIRFERDTPPVATYSAPVSSIQKTRHSDTFKNIAIRKDVPKRPSVRVLSTPINRVQRRPFNHSDSRHMSRIDGIVLSTADRRDRIRSAHIPTIQNKIRRSSEFIVDDVGLEKERPFDKKESSKIIPVIGGIVVFTLLVVVYIIFSFE